MGIYLDNAATSWPKAPGVSRGIKNYLKKCGGNPGRSGHGKAVGAARTVLEAREAIAELFAVQDPAKIIFTKNATEALNIALFGVLKKGDHLVTTSMEHNSVLRPANALKARGVDVTLVQGDKEGFVDPEAVAAACKENTKLVATAHASNVTGMVQDIAAISAVCREKNILYLVDAAQSAGVIPISLEETPVDFLALSGHKGLLGPQGTGCLCLRDHVPETLIYGGTGSLSDRDVQPDFLPDALESGTINTAGIAGLLESVKYLLNRGVEDIQRHDRNLYDMFTGELSELPRVKMYGTGGKGLHAGVLSINVEDIAPSEIGQRLDMEFGIQTRIGLHCAPMAHKTIGTFPDGTVRFGWGPFTKEKDIIRAAKAVKGIIGA